MPIENAKLAKVILGRSKISRARLFSSHIKTEVLQLSIHGDGRLKFLCVRAALVVRIPYTLNILQILLVRAFAEIGDGIVGFVSVDMIDPVRRPLPKEQQPSKPVSLIALSMDTDRRIRVSCGLARNTADLGPLGGSHEPPENSCCGVVRQELADIVRRKVGKQLRISHLLGSLSRKLLDHANGRSDTVWHTVQPELIEQASRLKSRALALESAQR